MAAGPRSDRFFRMNDVFISYAHIDDQPMLEGQRGWISQFHRSLEVRMAQLLGQELRIWRDPKLNGSDLFDAARVVLPTRYVKYTAEQPPEARDMKESRELVRLIEEERATIPAIAG